MVAAHPPSIGSDLLEPTTRDFYLRALDTLDRSGIPYLLGGTYSLTHFAGIARPSKDLDVFVRKTDAGRTLDLYHSAGYRTELTFPHWLGKAYAAQNSDDFVDIIFCSGNGLCPVDDSWFDHAADGEAFGRKIKLAAPEEMIWTKSFIQERERFDGADVMHLLLSCGETLDWARLLKRFDGGHEPVLLGHLLMFRYVYPSEAGLIPQEVMEQLWQKTGGVAPPKLNGSDRVSVAHDPDAGRKLCRGTFLSRAQYLSDIGTNGFADARIQPHGPLRPEDVVHWTHAIKTVK
jgi:hypothetical protein